jgi:hypothetical protein
MSPSSLDALFRKLTLIRRWSPLRIVIAYDLMTDDRCRWCKQHNKKFHVPERKGYDFFSKVRGSKYIVWTPPPLSGMNKNPGHGGHIFGNCGCGFLDGNDNRISKVTCAIPKNKTPDEAIWSKIWERLVNQFGCDEVEVRRCFLDHESLTFSIVECDSFVCAKDHVCVVGDASTVFLITGDLMNMGMYVGASLSRVILKTPEGRPLRFLFLYSIVFHRMYSTVTILPLFRGFWLISGSVVLR